MTRKRKPDRWTRFCVMWSVIGCLMRDRTGVPPDLDLFEPTYTWPRDFLTSAGGRCPKCKHVRRGLKHAETCLAEITL